MGAPDDIALLRRFEPVLRYTRGEQFFPMDVDRYVRACSLWVQRPDEPAACVIPEGDLTLEKLSPARADGFGAVTFLKFIEPLNVAQLAAYSVREGLRRRDPRDVFHAGRGRLARVGYGSRFVDALFSLTLLARGRVPGDTAAAARLAYRQMQEGAERYQYYGRVVRDAAPGWIALQYWYFYPFNDWRSGFFGVNDHEADWEMVYIYLSEDSGGGVTPQWVAYASHDFSGDDLRRRWDDPEVEKVGEHPVIYAGAGSHASYFSAGEYLTELELPFLSPLVKFTDKIQDFWVTSLRQAGAKAAKPEFNVFRIPFVDYARGDGVSLGPGQGREFSDPGLLDPPPDWAVNYRGLWGLYARDPIAGENAPAGPVYNRDGLMRRSWYDPLGWAGLDKVPPPARAEAVLAERRQKIAARRAELERLIREKSAELAGLGEEAAAMEGHAHLKKLHAAHAEQMAALSKELNDLRAELSARSALEEAVDLRAEKLRAGERGALRAHIQYAHHPAPQSDLRLSRVAELYSAVSIGLVMVGFVLIVAFARHYLLFGLAALLSVVIAVEAGFRRQLPQLIASVTLALAVVSALVLVFEFFWQVVVVGVLAGGIYIMWENARELRG